MPTIEEIIDKAAREYIQRKMEESKSNPQIKNNIYPKLFSTVSTIKRDEPSSETIKLAHSKEQQYLNAKNNYVKDKTILFHKQLGKGYYSDLYKRGSSYYILVRFTIGLREFIFPESIGNFLFLNGTKEAEECGKQFENQWEEFYRFKDSFINGKTALYHYEYGKGVFVGFKEIFSELYILVDFVYVTGIKFKFPCEIDENPSLLKKNHVFLSCDSEIQKRIDIISNPKRYEEDTKERNYYKLVKDKAIENYSYFSKKIEDLYQEKESQIASSYEDNQIDIFAKPFGIDNDIRMTNGDIISWRNAVAEPYFARIDLKKVEYYIGKRLIEDLVIDWRDSRAVYYYQYKVFINNSDVGLTLVRDYDIKNGDFIGFQDRYTIEKKGLDIDDEILLRIIENSKTKHRIHDIIETIQRNQYEIITCPENASILVSGCAGSGKTMILLHRISYLLFGNKNLYKQIIVLSPSKLLNLECDELSKDLNINEVERYYINDFYIKIINQFLRKYHIPIFDSTSTIISNDNVDEDVLERIYSAHYVSEYRKCIGKHLDLKTETAQLFIKKETENILIKFRTFLNNSVDDVDIKSVYDNDFEINQFYNRIQVAIESLSGYNVLEAIESLKKNEQRNERVYKQLMFAYDNFSLKGKPEYTKDGKIEIRAQSTMNYLRVMREAEERKRKIGYLREKDLFDFIIKYDEFKKQAMRFLFYCNGKTKHYIDIIIGHELDKIKARNELCLNKKYEFECFYWLLALKTLIADDILSDKTYLFFIDEYQNFSIQEFTLIKELYPHAVFNFYGDTAQLLVKKGIKDSNALRQEWELKEYWINENYRNAYEITDYTNRKLSKEMVPIGLKGDVRTCSRRDIIDDNYSSQDRIAIVVKDEVVLNSYNLQMIFQTQRKFNSVFQIQDQIEKESINVFTPKTIKGLEFDVVIVIEKGMNTNDKYVSYTRALTHLVIIND